MEVPLLTLRLLGSFQVRVNGADPARTRSRKAQRLLALLALRAGCEVERSWLAGTLWPDHSTSAALTLMRRELTDLRRALGPAARLIAAPTPRMLRLDPAEAAIDTLRFDAAIGSDVPAALEEAVSLYHGPLLEGWTEEWVIEARQTRERAYRHALATLAAQAAARGDDEAAERYLRRILAADPTCEETARTLMRRLAERGSRAAALQLYRDLRELLHREMNAAPDPQTTALFQQLRDPVRAGAPPGAGKRAGAPRLSPSPRSAQPARPSGSRLPVPLTRFIGRERERARVKRLLTRERLVTLTGAGGCGKTRLALQVAADLAEAFADGVWWVTLASQSAPSADRRRPGTDAFAVDRRRSRRPAPAPDAPRLDRLELRSPLRFRAAVAPTPLCLRRRMDA
jgi:DNA-binding SARP family transcriptional activator